MSEGKKAIEALAVKAMAALEVIIEDADTASQMAASEIILKYWCEAQNQTRRITATEYGRGECFIDPGA